jgi:hypothetical protein
MADTNDNEKEDIGVDLTQLSLSQAILAPLDSIYQAQIHGARSFLNMLLQIGYPHVPENVPVDELKKYKPYPMDFNFLRKEEDGSEKSYKVSIPALALVPINSLAIDYAEIKFGMKIKSAEKFQQIQESEEEATKKDSGSSNNKVNAYKRKWNLVKDPISLKGEIAPSQYSGERSSDTNIDIQIKLSKMPIPAGLEKLLTTLTNTAFIEEDKK